MKVTFFSNSLIGPRKENEDFHLIEKQANKALAMVADGVGGRNCGSMASKISVDSLNSYFHQKPQSSFLEAIESVNQSILDYSKIHPTCIGMASTLTCCTIEDDILKGIHVGDSRLYILRKNGLRQLSIDHTEAFKLYATGILTKKEFYNYPRRNVITSALGLGSEFEKQEFEFNLEPNDRIILSTDGFHGIFSKSELTQFSKENKSLFSYYQVLNHEITNRRLTDNLTFIVIQVDA